MLTAIGHAWHFGHAIKTASAARLGFFIRSTSPLICSRDFASIGTSGAMVAHPVRRRRTSRWRPPMPAVAHAMTVPNNRAASTAYETRKGTVARGGQSLTLPIIRSQVGLIFPRGMARRTRPANPVRGPVLAKQLPFVCSGGAAAGWRWHTPPNVHSSRRFPEISQTVSLALILQKNTRRPWSNRSEMAPP